MRKKKLMGLVSVLTACIMTCGSAYAATTISKISVVEGKVNVEGTTDSTTYLTYEVYDRTISEPTKADIDGFGEKYLTQSGAFSLRFGMKNGGSYKVRIFDGVNSVIGEFDYASQADRDLFVGNITSILASPDTAAALLDAAFSDPSNRAQMKTIGMDYDAYVGYAADLKAALCQDMVSKGANQTLSESSLLTLYTNAEIIAKINVGGIAYANQVLDALNYSFEGTAHTALSDAAQKAWIEQAVIANKPYADVTGLAAGYQKAAALSVINSARVTNIKEKVMGYASLLGIESAVAYTDYVTKASPAINSAVVTSLSGSKAETATQLLSTLAAAVGANPGGGGGGSISGGGGGGGGGGGSMPSKTPTVNKEIGIGNPEDNGEEESGAEQPKALFTDMNESHWAYPAVSAMKNEGIINGYQDGSFSPDSVVTREEFVKMIIVAFDLEDDLAGSHFHDVFDSDWFYPYVSAAFEKGIVMGDHLGLFGVHAGITRQDATVIAARTMRTVGKAIDEMRAYTAFKDEAAIADYAKTDVKALYCAGKINGTDTGAFEPERFCTRAEAATIIYGISR